MALQLANLDQRTWSSMAAEFDHDHINGKLYISDRLSFTGRERYPDLLKQAIEHHNDDWLAQQLPVHSDFNATFQRRKPKGGYSDVTMSDNAPIMLAEGEFNRFYIRGLCQRAIADGIPHLIVYRAKHVENPRSESEAKIGTTVDPRVLLEDLRGSTGMEPASGFPGPNSGLSVRLP